MVLATASLHQRPTFQEYVASGGSGHGFLCRHVQLLVQFGPAGHSVHLSHHQGQLPNLSAVTYQLTFALKQIMMNRQY